MVQECKKWLWKAALLGTAGALEEVTKMTHLPREFRAHSQFIQRGFSLILTEQPLVGPTMSSLLSVFLKQLKSWDYRVPAFAGLEPTCTAGNPPLAEETITTMVSSVKFVYFRSQT
jgi:hypothetical protein